MKTTMSIRASSELRTNYSGISKLAKEHPVAITVNGKEDIVILSHEDYNDFQNELAATKAELKIMQELLIAEQNVADGKIIDENDARNEILSIFN